MHEGTHGNLLPEQPTRTADARGHGQMNGSHQESLLLPRDLRQQRSDKSVGGVRVRAAHCDGRVLQRQRQATQGGVCRPLLGAMGA